MDKKEVRKFSNKEEMAHHLLSRSLTSGAICMIWNSEYGLTLATQPLKYFPDDELDHYEGDFNADWSNSSLPELLRDYDAAAFWYWWSWD